MMRKDIRFDASNNFHETWGARDNYEMHVENTMSALHFHTEIPAAAISDKRGVCMIMIMIMIMDRNDPAQDRAE